MSVDYELEKIQDELERSNEKLKKLIKALGEVDGIGKVLGDLREAQAHLDCSIRCIDVFKEKVYLYSRLERLWVKVEEDED